MSKTKTVRIDEAAAFLGIGRNSAYKAAKTGQIPSVRIGGIILVPRSALETMLRKAETTAATPTKRR